MIAMRAVSDGYFWRENGHFVPHIIRFLLTVDVGKHAFLVSSIS